MLRVALTGGIATGKSHVLARMAARGVPTIDADRLARQAVAPGTEGERRVAERFGDAVLARDRTIDRAALARIVFADPPSRRDLEAIVHPFVYDAIERWLGTLPAGTPAAVADIPLLFETGHEADFDLVVVTACSPDEQVRRLVARDGLAKADALARIATQWPLAEKAKRAGLVIDTNGSIEETNRQVDALLAAWSV
jgi:dephospho-CoA kinase